MELGHHHDSPVKTQQISPPLPVQGWICWMLTFDNNFQEAVLLPSFAVEVKLSTELALQKSATCKTPGTCSVELDFTEK